MCFPTEYSALPFTPSLPPFPNHRLLISLKSIPDHHSTSYPSASVATGVASTITSGGGSVASVITSGAGSVGTGIASTVTSGAGSIGTGIASTVTSGAGSIGTGIASTVTSGAGSVISGKWIFLHRLLELSRLRGEDET